MRGLHEAEERREDAGKSPWAARHCSPCHADGLTWWGGDTGNRRKHRSPPWREGRDRAQTPVVAGEGLVLDRAGTVFPLSQEGKQTMWHAGRAMV